MFGLIGRGSAVPKFFGFAAGALFAASVTKLLTNMSNPFDEASRESFGIPMAIQIAVFVLLALLALGASRRRQV